jgi:hypothetical protein
MTKSRIRSLGETNSALLHQLLPNLGSNKGTMTLNVEHFSGTMGSSFLDWNNENEFLITSFRVTDNMDAGEDIIVEVSCAEAFSTQTASIKWSIGAIKTDNTETFSFNILNAVTQSLSSSANARVITRSKTIANADIDQNDVVRIYIANNTNFDVNIYNVSIKFTEAT